MTNVICLFDFVKLWDRIVLYFIIYTKNMENWFWTLVSTIDWTENFHLGKWQQLDWCSPEVQEYIDTLSRIANEVQWLGELEKKLIIEFWEWAILNAWNIRLANAIGFENTLIRRNVDSIILPDGETDMPTTTNMGWNVIDSIAWSSKPPAPSKWYGLFWKIPQLRPNHDNFDEELHTQIMDKLIKLNSKWIAFEVWKDETALMPVFSIEWVDNLIQQFSSPKENNDTPTAKYYWINS